MDQRTLTTSCLPNHSRPSLIPSIVAGPRSTPQHQSPVSVLDRFIVCRSTFPRRYINGSSGGGDEGTMSSPGEFYKSLPPISKTYGTICFFTTFLAQFQLLSPYYVALIYESVFYDFQVWRLFTNFFWLGPFSINFGIRLLMIAQYAVQLEKGPFSRRTADYLWMMIFVALTLLGLSAIRVLYTPFLGTSMVFMFIYIWSREFPNAQINIYGLVQMKAFYFPWAMLVLDVIFGSQIVPDLLGLVAGHLYYFLAVLHPLAGGRNLLVTPIWVHKLIARLRLDAQANAPVQSSGSTSTGGAFPGRSYRLNR